MYHWGSIRYYSAKARRNRSRKIRALPLSVIKKEECKWRSLIGSKGRMIDADHVANNKIQPPLVLRTIRLSYRDNRVVVVDPERETSTIQWVVVGITDFPACDWIFVRGAEMGYRGKIERLFLPRFWDIPRGGDEDWINEIVARAGNY